MILDKVVEQNTNKIVDNRGISPLLDSFGYERDQNGFIRLLTVANDSNGVVSIALTKQDITYDKKINSINDLYKLILNSVPATTIKLTGSPQDDLLLSVHISQQANRIAMTTRRGAGNVLIAGSNVIKALNSILKPEEIKIPEGLPVKEIELLEQSIEPIYDYTTVTYKGNLSNSIRVYEDLNLDSNTIILAYSNNKIIPDQSLMVDGGLSAIVNDNDEVFIQTYENTKGICDWKDYYAILKLS